jgi:hypothetical protein
MIDQETEPLIQDIITRAVEGKSQPFRLILYWSEFKYYKRLVLTIKLIIRMLNAAADNLFKEYCRDVIAGISDITKLIAYQEILEIKAFYENDLNTVNKMLEDYNEYLGDLGNFIRALFGERRDV